MLSLRVIGQLIWIFWLKTCNCLFSSVERQLDWSKALGQVTWAPLQSLCLHLNASQRRIVGDFRFLLFKRVKFSSSDFHRAIFAKFLIPLTLNSFLSLYVHGGRDLKEGSISSMWRLNLTGILAMAEDDSSNSQVEWELVNTTGRSPGRISHHTVSVRPDKNVIFYGGLKGEDSNSEIFLFNPNSNSWLNVNLSVSIPSAHSLILLWLPVSM